MLRLTEEEAEQMFGRKKSREKRPKYGNKKCEWMGFTFDSIRERDRFIILDAALRDGEITNLRRQVKFQLIPKQYVNGKLVEHECDYIADFVYCDKFGNTIVEDAKGYRANQVWIMKRKLMLWLYGVRVVEV